MSQSGPTDPAPPAGPSRGNDASPPPPPRRSSGQTFLFVDNQAGEQQRRRSARAFVMRNARRERPWSTAKGGGPSGRLSASADTASPRASRRSEESISDDSSSAKRRRLSSTLNDRRGSDEVPLPHGRAPHAGPPPATSPNPGVLPDPVPPSVEPSRTRGDSSPTSSVRSGRPYLYQVFVRGMHPSHMNRHCPKIRAANKRRVTTSRAAQRASICLDLSQNPDDGAAAGVATHRAAAVQALHQQLRYPESEGIAASIYSALLLVLAEEASITHSQRLSGQTSPSPSHRRLTNYRTCLKRLIRWNGGPQWLKKEHETLFTLLLW